MTTMIYANSKSALALIEDALVGAKAVEIGGSTASALQQIAGVTANENAEGGATYTTDKVPSSAVNGGNADIYGETPMTVNLREGEHITVRGMLETAMTSRGVTMPAAKPSSTMKR